MIRPSLTFISVSLILILSGCSSVPIINDLSIKGGHENSYTHQMIDGYEEISKELRDEIAFILEEIFFYNRVDEANLEKAKNANKKAKKLARKANKALKKNLWDKYSYEIKNLTDVRGDYLTRLVHRETGVTTFDLIKKYKNPQTAFFWNSVLWSFNSTNLKNEFDPKRDWMLKLVVEEIEAGKIKPVSRARQLKELKAREAYEKAKKKKK